MVNLKHPELVKQILKFYENGLSFYSEGQYNIDPEERRIMFHKCLLQWNHWTGVLDGLTAA